MPPDIPAALKSDTTLAQTMDAEAGRGARSKGERVSPPRGKAAAVRRGPVIDPRRHRPPCAEQFIDKERPSAKDDGSMDRPRER